MGIPHPRDVQLRVVGWFDERFGLTKAVDEALYQRVPNYANAFYYCFGGIVFILIVLQIVTGIFLSFYYIPDGNGNPAPAYQSIQFIMQNVYLGWLIRGLHFWGAYTLIPLTAIHMARVFWTGSYRAPRELNWMVGIVMLLIVLAFGLTGYLLRWDTTSYWATVVTIKIGASAPFLGPQIKTFLQGGPVVGGATLQRWFSIHVFLLPAAVVLLMYVHFRLIRKHGISEPL